MQMSGFLYRNVQSSINSRKIFFTQKFKIVQKNCLFYSKKYYSKKKLIFLLQTLKLYEKIISQKFFKPSI